ncbi:SOH1-domain-containing protein [Bombardia bombarda]|uniref:Mediator of RNA polymerase II transcription subunit 31 n=1 Tax=Bombardia bombarda TaxID=252184 RepID=A0AA39X6J4_9PEZI|nr:SOH1-domain-containing protein [Bombardia bombarda]
MCLGVTSLSRGPFSLRPPPSCTCTCTVPAPIIDLSKNTQYCPHNHSEDHVRLTVDSFSQVTVVNRNLVTMASEPMSVGSSAVDPPTVPATGPDEPKYGGYTRFEMELEFVQSLGNPEYLNHLASRKLLTDPAFVAYLSYLQYWTRPPYLKYLTYPGPTLKALELLQQERFRQEIISPNLMVALINDGMKAAVEWHREG